MVQFYHIHPKLATTVTGECRTAGTPDHHSSCHTLPGFTDANEVSCTVNASTNRCKCIHDLPPSPGGSKLPREVRRVTSARSKPKSKKRKTKSKAKSTRSKKKKTTRRR